MDAKYDIEEIKKQIKEVITFSQGIEQPKVDEIVNKWLENKQKYINKFGGQLIYEYPEKVEFRLGTEEKANKVSDFCCLIENRYENYRLSDFLDNMKGCFFDNITDHDYYTVYKDENFVIKKGTKVVKAFKYFENDKNILFDLQNKAAQLLQEDKVSGKLCISVHPLDFLSSSENTYNWRSCHALDGEYKAGNFSYMLDDSTVICYLKADEDTKIPNFPLTVPWNSKKWRVLLFFSNDEEMMYLGRQYPFTADTAADFIKDKLLPKCGFHDEWTDWTNETISSSITVNGIIHPLDRSYVPVGGKLVSTHLLIKDGTNAMNFNDLLRSSCYVPMYSYARHKRPSWWFGNSTYTNQYGGVNTKFCIGAEVPCLRCGKDHVSVSETMMCNNCESEYGTLNNDDFGYCSVCDRHFYLDEGTWINDAVICPDCAETEVAVCDDCGGLYWSNDIKYDRETGRMLCYNCRNEY